MDFEKFDLSRLKLLPLSQRRHDMTIADVLPFELSQRLAPDPGILEVAAAVREAKRRGASVILMFGAHVIKRGLSRWLIRLMEDGFVTHFATNGAGAIHDFELALAGGTTESVAKYISEGQFGLWEETGRLNDAVNEGFKLGLGFGESVGRYIALNNFLHAEISVFAAGYKKRVPVTAHIGIGSDIAHEHPNFDGRAAGGASHADFLIYAKSVENLEGGVFLNFGSAVAGPEVYLKCLAMARNVAKQEGGSIANFTTAVFDTQPLSGENYREEPPKDNPRYYFRPWKTILARTVADGGRSFYIEGDHTDTLRGFCGALYETEC